MGLTARGGQPPISDREIETAVVDLHAVGRLHSVGAGRVEAQEHSNKEAVEW